MDIKVNAKQVGRCLILLLCAFASYCLGNATFHINRPQFEFSLYSGGEKEISLTLVAYDKLQNAKLNDFPLANYLPSESVLRFSPNGEATFFYYDTFLRHYRGRQQSLKNRIENLLSLPPSAQPPKVLRDVYQMNVSALYFNDWEDILWWTGEIVYKFDFPFPIKQLFLSSPDGSLVTTVGDWEWEKVGRAVHIYASNDGKNWQLMWKSPPPGGVTKVYAELPPSLKGSKTIYLKFVGQNNNVIYDLYLSAKLDARSILPLLKLKKGTNRFNFSYSSGGECLLSFEGVKARRPIFTYPKQLQVKPEGNELTIRFPQGIAIHFLKQGDLLKGISRVNIGNYEILANNSPTLPKLRIFQGKVEKLSDWQEYLLERMRNNGEWTKRGNGKIEELEIEECRYQGWERRGDGVVINTLIKAGERSGTLRWIFKPLRLNIEGRLYKGIGFALQIEGIEGLLGLSMEEMSRWESGDILVNQAWSDFTEARLGFLNPLELPERGYFAWNQPFLFYAGNDRAVLSFFQDVVYAQVGVAQEMDGLRINSYVPLKGRISPEKCWLIGEGKFSDKWDVLNEWTKVFDFLADKYRAIYGIRKVEPKPFLWSVDYGDAFERYKSEGSPELKESFLWRFAEEKLPILEKLGIKVIFLGGGIWESDAEYPKEKYLPGSECFGSGCAPWHLEISKALGGEPALAHLCETAHKRGIKIILWSTPAHLSNSSPLLVEHPEWIAQQADGIPVTWYGDVVGVSLNSGYFPYAISRYKALRKLGVDGFWQDSFLTFGILTDYSQPHPYPQLERTIAMQKAMQNMGYDEIYIEGCGPFGLSSGGADLRKIKGKEYGLYYYSADSLFDKEAYYRALASKGVMAILSLDILKEEDKEAVARFDRAFNQVEHLMDKRRLLGKGEEWLGVEWRNNKGKIVLFSFTHFNYNLPKGSKVRDITMDKPIEVKRELSTQPYHTYLIEVPRL